MYYRESSALIVTKDPDAISARRPFKYIEAENMEIEKTAEGKNSVSANISAVEASEKA